MYQNEITGYFKEWDDVLKNSISFWHNFAVVAGYQRDIAEHYKSIMMITEAFQKFVQLAPSNLWQDINPWSFSLMQFTREVKGSPVLEQKIVSEVAGYGSQLGTVMDVVDVLKEYHVNSTAGKSDVPFDEKYKFHKFNELVRKINRAKGSPEGLTEKSD